MSASAVLTPEQWSRAVVLVREARGHWVGEVAAAVHAMDRPVVLAVPPDAAGGTAHVAQDVDRLVVVDDVYDAPAVAARLSQCSGGVPPAGLLTGSDGAVAATARAAELLGVGRCRSDRLALAHNKFAVRQVLAGAGLPGPGCALLGGADRAEAVAARVGLPAVVKPVNGAASNLIRVVRSVAELAAAYRLLAQRLPQAPDPRYRRMVAGLPGAEPVDPARVVLVEGLLDGPEYAVDLLVRDAAVEPIEVLDKPLIDENRFELALSCPPALPDDRRDRVLAVAADAVTALGLDHTVAHVEVIDDATLGPTIVEVNAGRPAGSIMPLLGKLRTGIDVFAEMAAFAVGAPPPKRKPPRLPIPLAMFILYVPGGGRLAAIGGLDRLTAMPEVIEVVTTVEPGEVITDAQETYAVNLVVAGFADHAELAALYAEAAKLVTFELEEPC